MNISNLSYTEIQNLRILAEIKSFETGKNITMLDITGIQSNSTRTVTPKPLPFVVNQPSQKTNRFGNVNKRIRLRNHNTNSTDNFILVDEGENVDPDLNIISVNSAIGKVLKFASIGDNFTVADVEYSIIDIFNTPQVQTA